LNLGPLLQQPLLQQSLLLLLQQLLPLPQLLAASKPSAPMPIRPLAAYIILVRTPL